ncbi:molybdenum cofactor biosynthesis protein MoaE [Pedobacter sp. HMF7647]|uniref:Molybdopterin synthase catalytic subunit n=1 Tax=Hufsiella arboris TaxID=2695275 RepID=A0A7K1Y6T8_9SPHI|nr:molybdenum cofactor biosynthesis protein MoaE [Hufsiella arboris]MXV49758.1 molybdenum cofactor biosynthesis protein MoaE [Hufsiella arboris]
MTLSALSHQAAAVEVLTDKPIDLPGLLASSHHEQAGAVVLFSGDVRNHNIGREVSYLEYEAHNELAEKSIRKILEDAKEKWPLNIAAAQHRLGKVAILESAVVVITASAHRSEAFVANRYIIDRIKHETPIWKCEYYTNGEYSWGNNCNCAEITGDPDKHLYSQ